VFKSKNNPQETELEIKRLTKENAQLRRAVDELAILNDLALAISGSLDSEKIMRSIIGKSIRALEAEQGDITLVDEEKSDTGQTLVRSMVSSTERTPLHLNQNLLGWMQINKKPLMINDPYNDDRFKNTKWESSIRSLISAPLMARSKLIGILTVYNKDSDSNNRFTESDQRLLSIIAAQSAQVVENARLYEEEQALQFVRRELELASSIQKKLLPSEAPAIEGYSVSGKNLTAQTVGGDYFDFIRIEENRWALCLGDVSGKGLPASLLMSNLQAILRGQVLHLKKPSEILRNANRQLFHSTNSEKFATMFLGILESDRHRLVFSCAGHEYPFILKSDGTHYRLLSGGVPIGVLDNQEYAEESIELEEGDCLFVFSDGITDSINIEDERFGEGRLEKILLELKAKGAGPEEMIKEVFNRSIDHSGQSNRFDDMTAVVITRNR
jgi:sigma-B regulation protein RsbU (phosphoserine phosphatase)